MQFYVLKRRITKSGADTDFVQEDPVNLGQAPTCRVCGEYTDGLPWLAPYRVELELWGEAFGDLAFGPSMDFLVSERFKCLFEDNGLKGLEFLGPVEIVRVRRARGLRPPKYYCVRAIRSEALVDDARSAIVRSQPITCRHCYRGGVDSAERIILDASTWKGEDLFEARNLPGDILASKRFTKFCEEFNIINAVLIPAEEYTFSPYQPGRRRRPRKKSS